MTQCTVYSSWSSHSAYEKTETKRVEVENRKHFADYLLMQLNPVTSHPITNQAKKTTSGVDANFCFFSLSATREHRCAQCPPFLSREMFDSGNIGRELNQKFFQLNDFYFVVVVVLPSNCHEISNEMIQQQITPALFCAALKNVRFRGTTIYNTTNIYPIFFPFSSRKICLVLPLTVAHHGK